MPELSLQVIEQLLDAKLDETFNIKPKPNQEILDRHTTFARDVKNWTAKMTLMPDMLSEVSRNEATEPPTELIGAPTRLSHMSRAVIQSAARSDRSSIQIVREVIRWT
jgi:hypothetical protein